MNDSAKKVQVFGVGLNKTGTKTLAGYLRQLGYRHRSYDSDTTTESPSYDLYAAGDVQALMNLISTYDSCEDWPWPMLYQELDARFPDAKFVLTTRSSADVWYRSLCNMAVRIGPFPLYEKLVYGHDMPQGHREEMTRFYDQHNADVRAWFADRPGKLLEICWENGDTGNQVAEFLGSAEPLENSHHINASPSGIYAGDNPLIAHLHRLAYQNLYGPQSVPGRIKRRLSR